MLFKRYLILSSVVVLLSCSQEENSEVVLKDTISSIEEVNALIAETRFVIDLPNGQSVDFVPNEQFRGSHSTDFASAGSGFNFSELNDPIVINGALLGHSGTLNLGDLEYHFPIAFCFSIEELGEILNVNFAPSFQNYEAYFAVESDSYSDIEIINFQPIGVDNFLFLFVDKNEKNIDFGDGIFYRKDGLQLILLGNYNASPAGVTCQGEAYLDGFNLSFYDEFSAEIHCN